MSSTARFHATRIRCEKPISRHVVPLGTPDERPSFRRFRCSTRIIHYHSITLRRFSDTPSGPFTEATTGDIRGYPTHYQNNGNVGNGTVDNIRRIISTLFAWL